MEMKEQIRAAFEARRHSYSPYSNFCVGAALLTKEGKLYQGCNIENAAYSVANCAERTAFFTAIYQGEREFESIVIVGGPREAESFDYCEPCGVCRQVMAEFCEPESFRVIFAKSEEEYQEYLLQELLPHAFLPGQLK